MAYNLRKVFTITTSPFNVNFDHDRYDEVIFLANEASGTINLPSAVAFQAAIFIKKVAAAAGTITIAPFGSETIDGAANFSLAAQFKFVHLVSDNANWQIFASN